jgi:hypothetical protein
VPYGKLNIAIELPSNEAVLAAVLAGAGATILSARVCADLIKAGTLKRLPVSLAPRAFYAVQHADRYRSRASFGVTGNPSHTRRIVIFHWPPGAYTLSVFHSSQHHPLPKVHAFVDLSLETIR